jgi:uncharacterized protein (DUF111 family)
MKVLFLDCFSGISGDMTVGALCDLGVKPSALEWELSKLEVGDFHMHFAREQRHNLEGVAFSIHEGATHTEGGAHEHGHSHDHGDHHDHGHSHEHEHTHGDEHGHEHGHEHEHEHEHADEHAHSHGDEAHQHQSAGGKLPSMDQDHGAEVVHAHTHGDQHQHKRGHEHGHSHGEHEHSHEHEHGHGHSHEHGEGHHHHHVHGRSHREIRELIGKSGLSPYVKEHALSIFQRIAIAEGKIHGQSPDDVAFHEVGALDSIADIVCVCIGLEALGVERVYVSALHDGRGFIDCAHGRFPLPAPATLEILAGIPIGQIDEPHELITPTGAAIVAEFGTQFGLMPSLTVEKVGYGIGARKLASRPNVLRAVLGDMPE